MAATTRLKKSPYMIEWMVQANPPEESSTVKKWMTGRYSSL